jgi:predicted Zn-dependent peptidase
MYNKSVLGNGVRIVTEKIPHVYSVSVGIWVEAGSRGENQNTSGITHFIEHMLFKGTSRRAALDIAREIESVGGIINAFTTKEYTFFYSKVLREQLSLAADILSDIFLNSLFEAEELEKERKVVTQEILMIEDNPEEYIHDYLSMNIWPGDPLGMPTQGTCDTLRAFTREDVVTYFREHFRNGGIIITAVGNLDHEEVVSLFSGLFESEEYRTCREEYTEPGKSRGNFVQSRDIEQAHLCLGLPAPGREDNTRYASFILNSILGGGMSSRLFQEVREKRGLVYSVYSTLASYRDTGMLKVYAGTTKECIPELLSVVSGIFRNLREKPVTPDELRNGKEQIKGNMLISLESTDFRLTRLASNEMYFRKYISPGEVAEKIDGVTLEDVLRLAERILVTEDAVVTAIGKVEEKEVKFQ